MHLLRSFPKSSFIALLSCGAAVTFSLPSINAKEPVLMDEAPSPVTLGPEVNWITGEGVNIGGILFPSAYLRVAAGATSGASASRLAVGEHDPFRDGVTFQGLDLGMSLRAGDYLEGFINAHIFADRDDDLDAELEEAFLKLHNLPGGFEVRGGLMLNRFGFQNARHMHSWDFVDREFGYGRFLGEEGLRMIGGELTWNLPTTSIASAISVGIGVAETHDHHHGHGHGHGHHHHDEDGFEGEEALYDDFLLTASWLTRIPITDFHQISTVLSYGYGDNEFGRNTHIAGLGIEYQWRERGLERGGRFLRWRNEVFYRNFGALIEEDDHHGRHGHGHGHHGHGHGHGHGHHDDHDDDEVRRSFEDIALVSALVYGVLPRVDLGLRGEYVSGIGAAEDLDERFRVSPNLTFWLNDARTMFLRLQYNYDHSNDFGDAHSGWAQFGLNWGGPEVR